MEENTLKNEKNNGIPKLFLIFGSNSHLNVVNF
jgi:hypothetical protein